MNKNDLYYLALINKEFDFLSINSIKTSKCQNKTTYKDLYFNIVERYKILNECQNLCADLEPMDLYPVFKCRVKTNVFLRDLYNNREQLVRKSFIAKTKKVLDYIKSKDFERYKRKSMTALANELGLSPYFFTHMKRLSKEKNDLVMGFHKDKYKSVKIFRIEMLELMNTCKNFCENNRELAQEIFLHNKQHLVRKDIRYSNFLKTLRLKEPLKLQYKQIMEIISFEEKIEGLV